MFANAIAALTHCTRLLLGTLLLPRQRVSFLSSGAVATDYDLVRRQDQ
jgi:hypothetical protein